MLFIILLLQLYSVIEFFSFQIPISHVYLCLKSMLVIGFHDLRQPDVFIMITGGGIFLGYSKPDGILRAMVDTRHAHLTVFSCINRFLIFQADTPCRADPCAYPASDTVVCDQIYILPLLC